MRLPIKRKLCSMFFALTVMAAAGAPLAHAYDSDRGENNQHTKPKKITNINNGNSYSFHGTGSITAGGTPAPTPTPTPTTPPVPCGSGSQDAGIVYTALPVDVLQCPKGASLGYEGTGTREFGDGVGPIPVGRTLTQLRVLFQSFGCGTSGRWNTGDCVTSAGGTFTHPITANIYAVDNSSGAAAPGPLLATVTQTQSIPYRPSANPAACTGSDAGKFLNTNTGQCANAIGQLLTFNFPTGTTLPSQIIWTVAFNTTHYGNPPIGENTACYVSSAGCGYDALNVGVFSFPGAPYRGTDTDPNGTFLNSVSPSAYCDGGTGGTGVLRLDTPCWPGQRPLGEIRTS